MSSDLDQLSINTIRFLAVDAVQKANSGHPGMPMGAAPMAYVLWTKHMKYNPVNPHWFDRDRFVLSAGHGSMLLYAMLYLTGYDLPLSEIERFRQWESKTPGHPERTLAPGLEVTTGPLGQGFGNGVGMAIAEANLAARYNQPGYDIVDHYTYAIISDGDIMEGVSSEAASIAGHLKLGKLIYLYDANRISLSSSTDLTLTENVQERFDAYGWHVQTVEDGNDIGAIDRAVAQAQMEKEKPSLIVVHTHIGYGAPHKHDTFEAHGSPLGEDEVKAAKENLGWPLDPPFYVPQEALNVFRQAVDKGSEVEEQWNSLYSEYKEKHRDLAQWFEEQVKALLPNGWDSLVPEFPADPKGVATRVAGGKVLNAITKKLPSIIGGSADLNPSTYTELEGMGDFQSPADVPKDKQGAVGDGWSYAGRNLWFGVREHAMGSILNGIAVHEGFIPFGATFLSFSDYMRPPIRLAALMQAHVIYVFTHDSLALGEDGPTHQPVEQLLSLRAIPSMWVIRPCDANETAVAWKTAVERRDGPVSLILTRQKVPVLDREEYASAEGLRKGAYVISDAPGGKPDIILIASGSEVSLVLEVKKKLEGEDVKVRVVSMPCWELFNHQPREYRDSVLPPYVRTRLAVEAGSPIGWREYVGDRGVIVGVDRFGASAPGDEVMEKFGFNVDNIWNKALELLGEQQEENICTSV